MTAETNDRGRCSVTGDISGLEVGNTHSTRFRVVMMPKNDKEPNVHALVKILLDHSARIDERDDAAMYLASSDDKAALTALLHVASDPADNELVVASSGESLAQMIVRTGRLDRAWIEQLAPAALNEVIPWVTRERPDLLTERSDDGM
jgi:hypothetical protein